MRKRILSALLTLCMIASMLPSAFAADETANLTISVPNVTNYTNFVDFEKSYDSENDVNVITATLHAYDTSLLAQKPGSANDPGPLGQLLFHVNPGTAFGTAPFMKENTWIYPAEFAAYGPTTVSDAKASVSTAFGTHGTATYSDVWPTIAFLQYYNGTSWINVTETSTGGTSIAEHLCEKLSLDDASQLVYGENYRFVMYEDYSLLFGWKDTNDITNWVQIKYVLDYAPIYSVNGAAKAWYNTIDMAIAANETDIFVGANGSYTQQSDLEIGEGVTLTIDNENFDYADGKTVTIKNGGKVIDNSNNSDVEDYIIEQGGILIHNGITFMADIAIVDAKTEVNDITTISDETLKTAVLAAAKSIETEDLSAAAASIAQNTSVSDETAQDALTNAGISPENATVTIAIQPYLDITVEDAEKDVSGNITTLTLDITPMYQTIATTAGNLSNIELDGASQNAVAIGSAKKLNVTTPVEISIELPNNFVSGALQIKHTKSNVKVYYYDVTVSGNPATATFTVTNGFSDFKLSAKDTRQITVTYDAGKGELTTDLTSNQEAYAITNAGDTLPSAKRSGYSFKGWEFTYDDSEIEGITSSYKTLPDLWAAISTDDESSDFSVSATAVWGTSSGGGSTSSEFDITIKNASNGKVTASDDTAEKGDTVTLTPKANSGYELDSITVTDEDGDTIKLTEKSNGTYTFTMPNSDVTVKASFVKSPEPTEMPFTDVSDSAWYYDSVKYVYENEIMNGTSGNAFSPSLNTSRAMIATMVYRMEGEPTVSLTNTYSDVTSGSYYEKAVAWASQKGIVTGFSDGTFGPNSSVTREQLAAILYRYADYKKYDMTASADLSGYGDKNAISNYALPAMHWANAKELITGTTAGLLNPKGNATRAEVAAIFTRFCENAAK